MSFLYHFIVFAFLTVGYGVGRCYEIFQVDEAAAASAASDHSYHPRSDRFYYLVDFL
jgi:hypothetical protein